MRRILDIPEPFGGLGDGLIYSTLPELYSTVRGDQVYISSRTSVRNPEVADLLYKKNPYILGMSDDGEKIGHCNFQQFCLEARHWNSPTACMEKVHGFKAPYNLRPKIYYKPNLWSQWKDQIFADMTSHSQAFPAEIVDRFVAHLLLDPAQIWVASSQYQGQWGRDSLSECRKYTVRDIYEYIDIIYSCGLFLSTESGGHVVAAAVRESGSYALCTTMHNNSRFYVFPNILYTTTGKLSDDYLATDLTGENVHQV